MRVLIAEEAYLWEIPEQITDYHGIGTAIVHGPWRPADCRQVLLRWFDTGLLECIALSAATEIGSDEVVRYDDEAEWRVRAARQGQVLILAVEDARALLSDPSTWQREGVGAGVMLCHSDAADGLSFDDWFAGLAGLPDDLIYETPSDRASEAKPPTVPEADV
jgi:hypothetical protein